MKHIYTVDGMTCNACETSVQESLSKVTGVTNVDVNLQKGEAEVSAEKYIPLNILQLALAEKYSISEKGNTREPVRSVPKDFRQRVNDNETGVMEKTKLQQLKPLLLIFIYLFAAAFLLNNREWNLNSAMLDFMGLFYIVFSFFKFLDLKGFPASFKMYDPLARTVPIYGWIYPFIELILGLMFLFRFQINVALIVTIVVLGITTIGVTKTLLNKKSIRCACLGTALKLPMTEATFIENAIMLIMAITMLIMSA